MPYSTIKDLPVAIQSALKEIGYTRQDIEVQAKEVESMFATSGDGMRGFVCLVNMETGESKVTWGSWGGSNMFTKTLVDDCDKSFAIPHNVAVIKGSKGEKCYAHISIAPSNMAALLPVKAELSAREVTILRLYKEYISSYRKEELRKMRVTEEELGGLVKRGYLTKRGVGLGITTEGKNALSY